MLTTISLKRSNAYYGQTLITSLAIFVMIALQSANSSARTLPTVTISGVATNHGSVKVAYNFVSGAKDYRIYDLNNPSLVKYAGISHLFADYGYHFVLTNTGHLALPCREESNYTGRTGPNEVNVPALEIEWNGLQPGVPTTLVVEAVDAMGPFPMGNVATDENMPAYPDSMGNAMGMLGSNDGMTMDNLQSINGHGDIHNRPNVIARSLPLVVTGTGVPALPSGKDASQVFFDTFSDAMPTLTPIGTVDPVMGVMQYQLTTMEGNWDIITRKVDTMNSCVMVDRGHLMDVMYDGGTPGTGVPLHVSHASIAYSPHQTFDFSGGKVLHATYEVDSHTDNRRWVGLDLAPANDPITDWYPTEAPINHSDVALFTHVFGNHPAMSLFRGVNPATSLAKEEGILGQYGGSTAYFAWRHAPYFQCGRGLDDRSRFDLFVSTTHYAWYEDGALIDEHDFPTPLPFSKAKAYFTHYLYHSQNEVGELMSYAPWDTFWINKVTYSDERHWDNMGIEILPARTNWKLLANRVQLPLYNPPVFMH